MPLSAKSASPLNVIVFGATGSVGRLTVSDLLDQGHNVTAYARHPEKLDVVHPALRHIAGDALDAEAVARAVAGHDAAIIVLGAGAARRSTVRSHGTLNVIQAMQNTGVRRLVCQSTLGAHESWSNLNFFWKRIMFGLLLKPVFHDHELQENLVRASGLDWTIVRPSAFSESLPQTALKENIPPTDRSLSLKIARTEVAGFLARMVEDRTYLHRAVGISH